MADQSIYPDGLEHQNNSECGRRSFGSGLGVTGNRTMGPDIQLSAFALSTDLDGRTELGSK